MVLAQVGQLCFSNAYPMVMFDFFSVFVFSLILGIFRIHVVVEGIAFYQPEERSSLPFTEVIGAVVVAVTSMP